MKLKFNSKNSEGIRRDVEICRELVAEAKSQAGIELEEESSSEFCE